jgi:hypothetical protein
MSDCDWAGMDVFGTPVVAPGPSDLPSTVLTTVSAAVEQTMVIQQASGGVFTTVLVNNTGGQLGVRLTRQKKTRALLVSLRLTGTASGFAAAASLALQTLVNTNPIFTNPRDTNQDTLLVRRTRVDLTSGSTTFKSSVAIGYTVLVPPEVLPDATTLDFLVQFAFQNVGAAGAPAGAVLTVDPREDALVVQEIGPFSL